MIMPQGATMICSLCVHQQPNCAWIFFSLGIASNCWMSASSSLLSTANSSSSSSSSMSIRSGIGWSSGVASLGWATCARCNCSFSWKCACPHSWCMHSTSWWAVMAHVRLPSMIGLSHPTIAQMVLCVCAWSGQKWWWLFASGVWQLWRQQQVWPTVMPSITTTHTLQQPWPSPPLYSHMYLWQWCQTSGWPYKRKQMLWAQTASVNQSFCAPVWENKCFIAVVVVFKKCENGKASPNMIWGEHKAKWPVFGWGVVLWEWNIV